MPFDAVIFDLDGVLVDSEPLWHQAEIAAFGEVGLELTPADCLQTTGLRIDAVVAWWRERRPWTADVDVATRVLDRMEALLRTCPPKRGALRAVEQVRASGRAVGIASSSPHRLIRAVVETFDLHLDALCSAEDDAHGKPHPAVYLRAARSLGVPPDRCLAVEDSANGIRSALAAGMRVVAVPDQPVAAEILAHTTVLDSLEALPALLAG